MSRIGKLPITIPEKVQVDINNQNINVTGPYGNLKREVSNLLIVEQVDSSLYVKKRVNSRLANQLHGLTRTLLSNMVIGVSEKFEKRLLLEGVGYRAQIINNELILNLGYSHSVNFIIPKELDIQIEKTGIILIKGFDKELVGQFAATIKNKRPPEPYKGKGILYQGENIKRKVGKSGKK